MPGNWLSRIGIVALFIGLGFLAKLAYDEGWVSPIVQLLAGLGCGTLLLVAGHHWSSKYRAWAQAVTGGGIAVLYLSFFASYALNDLMGFYATFALMSLVTVLAVGIALRRDSMSIAIIGIVGAFLVPITLGAIDQSADGGGGNNTGSLIAYVLTLDAAVVWLASLRNWRWFTLLGFVGSMAIFSLWYCMSEKEGLLWQAQGLLTGIFLCFAAATTLFHGLWRHRPQLTDLALMTVNAAIYFGLSHYLLWEGYQPWLGALGFGLAAFYAVLGYLFLRRSKDNKLLSAFAFGIAITFLTVAIPVQLEKSYMTAAWAAEGAVLIWLAVQYGTPRWQLWGLGAFALVLIRLFAFDQFVGGADFTSIMNNMFWAFVPSVVAFYAAAFFLRHKEKALQSWFFPTMMLLASFLTMWLFSFEIINLAGSRIMAARDNGVAGYDFRSVENTRNLALVALWGMYGLALACAGAMKSWVWLRLGGYVLVGMAVGTTLVELNYLHAAIRNGGSNPIVNYSFGALAVCVSVLSVVACLLRKCGDRMTRGERTAFPVVGSMASILLVYALSAEAFTFLGEWVGLRNLAVVALWAAYGLVITIVGLWQGWVWLRVQGWILLLMAIGMTVATLNYGHFLMDGDPLYPIVNYSFGAFAICIGVVSEFAYLVAAYGKRLHSVEKSAFPLLVSMASVLLVYALSAEVFTFLDYSLNVRNLVLVALWAGYGLGIMMVGLWRGWGWLRAQGWLLALMAIGATVTTLNYGLILMKEAPEYAIGNYSFGAFAICIGLVSVFAYLVSIYGKRLHSVETSAFSTLVSVASILLVYALSAEVFTFLDESLDARNIVVVALWAAYGLGVMIVGLWRGWGWLRVQGWILALMAIAMTMITLNYGQLLMQEPPENPIGNYSFGAFAICIGVVGALAYLVAANRKRFDATEVGLFPVLVLAANFLFLWAMSSEVITFVRDSENAQNLLLVAVWCTYGLGLLGVGVRKKWDWLRMGGYLLAVVATGATLTLLNHNHAMVSSVSGSMPILNYSLGGFAICTVGLYLYAYTVARNREWLPDFEKIVCILGLAAASGLTLWGLSEEIVAFLDGNLQSLMLVVLWLGYGSLLMAIGVARKALLPRIGACALMVMGVASTGILLNHWWAGIDPEYDWPILNCSFGAFAACVLASYLFAYLTARQGDRAERFNQVVCGVALAVANVLTVWVMSAEVITFLADVGNLRNLVLVVVWSGYGLLLTVAGAWKGIPVARFSGCALVAAAVGMTTTMLNHGQAAVQRSNSDAVINPSFGGFCICVIALYVVAYLVSRSRDKLLHGESLVSPLLILAANGLSLFALSSEVVTYAPAGSGQSMGLTVLWAAYGLAVMVAGIMGRWPWVRLGGLALVSVAVLKLFIWDTLTLDDPYRVAAYISLGVLLLAGGFVYHRYADVIKGFIMDRLEKGVGSAQK